MEQLPTLTVILFEVPSDATLTISFIGYKTVELPVAGKTSFTVTLKEDSEMLDEVVVVGFGTQKKVNLTGSVGLATAKEIEARPVANATQALQAWYRACRLRPIPVNWTRICPSISVATVPSVTAQAEVR